MLYNRNYHLGSILWTCPVTCRKEFNAKFYLSPYLYEYKLDYSYVYFIYLSFLLLSGNKRGKVFFLEYILFKLCEYSGTTVTTCFDKRLRSTSFRFWYEWDQYYIYLYKTQICLKCPLLLKMTKNKTKDFSIVFELNFNIIM